MSCNWHIYSVEQIAASRSNALSTGPFGSAISSKYFTSQGVPVIRGSNLSTSINNRLSDDNLVFVSEEKAKEFSRSIVKKGDLIFTCWGTINQVGLIDGSSKFKEYVISNKQMKLTPHSEKADSLYLYYLFSSPNKQHEILTNAIGAAVPGFNLGQLKKIKLCLPPLIEQKRITKILGDLDAKIKLNDQINQTLEQMAQALFKSWFVDFEPVKAKMAVREVGGTTEQSNLAAMQVISGKTEAQVGVMKTQQPKQYEELKVTAELFPDAMQESELGDVPVGWEVMKINDVVQRLKPKKRFTKKQILSYGKVPVFEQGASILLGFHNEDSGFKATPDNPLFIFGDHTCITHLSCSEFDISQNVIPLKGSIRPTIWTFYAIEGKQSFQEYRRHWSEFVIKKICIASEGICQNYSVLVAKQLLMIESLKNQNVELTQLRDTFLPKLLSGELSVSNTGKENDKKL